MAPADHAGAATPPAADLLPLIALVAAIGAFAGVIAGMPGVGGGLVLVAAYVLAFGVLGHDAPHLIQVCLATSLATIVVTSMRSIAAHHRRGAVDWAILRALAPVIAVGAVLGMVAAASLRSATLQLIFGVLALCAGLYMAFGRADGRLGAAMPGGVKRVAMGGALGLSPVRMGIGGGTFGVPLLSLDAVPIHRALATATGFGRVIALPAVIGFLFLPVEAPPPLTLGAVNLPAFALTIAMTILTTPLGVRLAHATNAAILKRAFAVFVLLVALNMLRKVAGW